MTQVLRETKGYVATKSARGVRITSKEKGVERPSIVVTLAIWSELQKMNDQNFDGSCCLELGIGAFKKGR